MNANSRLEQLLDRRSYLRAESRTVNAKELADLELKIKMYDEVVGDMQIRIAGEMQYMEGRNVFQLKNGREIGKLRSGAKDLVVWDKDGKIKEVIKRGGDTNKG